MQAATQPPPPIEIGVFGSARLTPDDIWWQHAGTLGGLLAAAGFTVVTGGYGGLMEATARGAHEAGGRVIGLPMRKWKGMTPNQWHNDLVWSGNYGTRLAHFMKCKAVIALPGGIGTLLEICMVWATTQTERSAPGLILLGECWPPIVRAIQENLIVDSADIALVRTVQTAQEAVAAVHEALHEPPSASDILRG